MFARIAPPRAEVDAEADGHAEAAIELAILKDLQTLVCATKTPGEEATYYVLGIKVENKSYRHSFIPKY